MAQEDVEILNLETLVLTNGISAPKRFDRATAIQFQNTFLVAGGIMSPQDAIYRYEVDSGGWTQLPETLNTGRYDTREVVVPDAMLQCIKDG